MLIRFVALAALALLVVGSTASSATIDYSKLDYDPLRSYLPSPDLFEPVPGGSLAVGETGEEPDYEDKVDKRDGGLIAGYCMRWSCRYVTHVVVAQVCDNQIGGKDGANKLVLGVIKLPLGGNPGYIVTLQGRNYAENFAEHGPFIQQIQGLNEDSENANFSLLVENHGAVAPIEYDGMEPKKEQKPETLAFQMRMVKSRGSSRALPMFEVRHLCPEPMS